MSDAEGGRDRLRRDARSAAAGEAQPRLDQPGLDQPGLDQPGLDQPAPPGPVPPVPAPPGPVPPAVDQPSDDVERPGAPARLPGAPRGVYTKFPTDPIDVLPVVEVGPRLEDGGGFDPDWEPAPAPVVKGRLAASALTASIVALIVSFFVGWALPVALAGTAGAIMALRRRNESREVATWALVLGLCATVFSLGWLLWAAMTFEQWG